MPAKLTGQQGTKSDYENLLTELRTEVRLAAIDKILARHAGEEIPRNIPLTTPVLRRGSDIDLMFWLRTFASERAVG